MSFDHSAAHAQVGRIVTHAAGDSVLLTFGAQTEIPAIVNRDKAAGTDATKALMPAIFIVTLARTLLAAPLPRVGQHFSDAAGRIFRISEDRTVPFHPNLVYACLSAT